MLSGDFPVSAPQAQPSLPASCIPGIKKLPAQHQDSVDLTNKLMPKPIFTSPPQMAPIRAEASNLARSGTPSSWWGCSVGGKLRTGQRLASHDGKYCPACFLVLCPFPSWYRAVLNQSAQMAVHVPLTVSSSWSSLTGFLKPEENPKISMFWGSKDTKQKKPKPKPKLSN